MSSQTKLGIRTSPKPSEKLTVDESRGDEETQLNLSGTANVDTLCDLTDETDSDNKASLVESAEDLSINITSPQTPSSQAHKAMFETSFPLSVVNPLLVSSLSSPFLSSNLFLNSQLSSPVLDSVIRNTWMFNRWNELPSTGLQLPTPIFPEMASNLINHTPDQMNSNISVDENNDSNQLLKVKWKEHHSSLCSFISSLYFENESKDLKLMTRSGEPVSAHRLVMASASPFLRKILKDIRGDQVVVVVLPVISSVVLESIVNLCYTGKIEVMSSLSDQVMNLVNDLDMSGVEFLNNKHEDSGIFTQKSPSPPSVFTFPTVHKRSPPSYTAALEASYAGGKRRPLTPDLTQLEGQKRIRVGPTFLPEVQDSLKYKQSDSSKDNTFGHFGQTSSSSDQIDTTPSNSSRNGSLSGSSGGSRVLLWKFLLQLLNDDRFSPVYIRWVDKSTGIFRIMESDMVAKLWGRARNNSNMNYEKMSRGMRTYYKRGILYHIDGTKLIYKFNTSDPEVQHYMKVKLFHHGSLEGGAIDGILSADSLSHLAELKNEKKSMGDSGSSPNYATVAVSSNSSSQRANSLVYETFLTESSLPNIQTLTNSNEGSLPNQGESSNLPANNSHHQKRNQPIFPSRKRNFALDFFNMNKPRSNSIPNFQTSTHFANFLQAHNRSTENDKITARSGEEKE